MEGRVVFKSSVKWYICALDVIDSKAMAVSPI